MAGSESRETQRLREEAENLEMALVPELSWVAHRMNKSYLLSDEDLNTIIAVPSSLTDTQKASKMVTALKRMVKLNSGNFLRFVDILRNKPHQFESIIELLLLGNGEYLHMDDRSIGKDESSQLKQLQEKAEHCLQLNDKDESSFKDEKSDGIKGISTTCTVDDLLSVQPELIHTSLNHHNITIVDNYGLNGRTGFWWFVFNFDHAMEKEISVRLTNFKHNDRQDWTLEIVKCAYLGIHSEKEMASFDMADELINNVELAKLVASIGSTEKLRKYLETNIVPIVTKKIKYTKYKPQFRFFLSHMVKDRLFMRTFESGLKFLGYDTWFVESNRPFGNIMASLKTAIDSSDTFLFWINEEYMENYVCQAELLYARQQRKILLPFADKESPQLQSYFTGKFAFLNVLHIYFLQKSSFFEILCHIDEALFNFEVLAL